MPGAFSLGDTVNKKCKLVEFEGTGLTSHALEIVCAEKLLTPSEAMHLLRYLNGSQHERFSTISSQFSQQNKPENCRQIEHNYFLRIFPNFFWQNHQH